MRRKELSDRERDRLLVKHLLGEASPEESEKIQHWMGAHLSHRQYADEFRRIWVESRRLAPTEPVDPAAAWERFLESGRLKASPAGTRVAFTRKTGTHTAITRSIGTCEANLNSPVVKSWSAIAASIILLAVGAYTWWKLDTQTQTAALTWQSGAATRIDTLPDGSRVTLNKFSSVALPGGKTSRVVQLSGEAFFEVTHDARQPFTVRVNDVTIRDVGTGFNVRSMNGTTEIIVETGAILVTAGSGTVRATAGEKVLVTANGTKITRTPVSNRLYQYYRTKSFVCRKTPLSELIIALNEAYGTNIVVQKEEINRLQITATFDNEGLDSILTVITRTFGLNIQKKGGSILLKQP